MRKSQNIDVSDLQKDHSFRQGFHNPQVGCHIAYSTLLWTHLSETVQAFPVYQPPRGPWGFLDSGSSNTLCSNRAIRKFLSVQAV